MSKTAFILMSLLSFPGYFHAGDVKTEKIRLEGMAYYQPEFGEAACLENAHMGLYDNWVSAQKVCAYEKNGVYRDGTQAQAAYSEAKGTCQAEQVVYCEYAKK